MHPLQARAYRPEDHADLTLAQAQTAKLDLMCRTLRLGPVRRFLDIGCGWAALVRHAAGTYGIGRMGVDQVVATRSAGAGR